jgi:hypothetical protein
MALIDTALVTAKDALADVTEVASASLGTISATIGDRAEEKRSHKGRVFLLILLVLAVLGFIAWKKSSSTSESEADTAAA